MDIHKIYIYIQLQAQFSWSFVYTYTCLYTCSRVRWHYRARISWREISVTSSTRSGSKGKKIILCICPRQFSALKQCVSLNAWNTNICVETKSCVQKRIVEKKEKKNYCMHCLVVNAWNTNICVETNSCVQTRTMEKKELWKKKKLLYALPRHYLEFSICTSVAGVLN